jgi:hypothetical protein
MSDVRSGDPRPHAFEGDPRRRPGEPLAVSFAQRPSFESRVLGHRLRPHGRLLPASAPRRGGSGGLRDQSRDARLRPRPEEEPRPRAVHPFGGRFQVVPPDPGDDGPRLGHRAHRNGDPGFRPPTGHAARAGRQRADGAGSQGLHDGASARTASPLRRTQFLPSHRARFERPGDRGRLYDGQHRRAVSQSRSEQESHGERADLELPQSAARRDSCDRQDPPAAQALKARGRGL